MRELEPILEDIRSCKTSGRSERLESLFNELEMTALETAEWPSALYRAVVELQQDPDFLSLEHSWTLLYFLNNCWDQLSFQQREELRDALKSGFDRYRDWMGAFVTSEILGERYADEKALKALVELGRSARLPARAAVPHGLEALAVAASRESLRDGALHHLRELQENESAEVRREAEVALKNLGQGER